MSPKPQLKPIRQDLIIDRITFENPWWKTGRITPELDSYKRRLYFHNFFPFVQERTIRRALVLMGPRRVGKTVIMQHAIQRLIDEGTNPNRIIFISTDNPIYMHMGLEELFTTALSVAGSPSADEAIVFFDEIQYLKQWEVHLKSLVDSYPKTKFIVSGSAAAALKLKSIESGAGRFTDFMLPPLTFHEYIDLLELEHLLTPSQLTWKSNIVQGFDSPNIKELNRHFFEYLNFGGYPELIFSEKMKANPGRYIKGDIIDKVLLRDLPSLYGIQDVQELNAFFASLAYYSGTEMSLEALSQNSGVNKNLLKKYLEYLEAAFMIRVIHRMDDNATKFQRATHFKIYLTNPSLRSALFTPIEPHDDLAGELVETTIFSQWFHVTDFVPWYARWKKGRTEGEVDMIGLAKHKFKPDWALEVKWSNRYFDSPKSLKSLLYFCKKNRLSSALVTSKERSGTKIVDDVEIHFVPAAVWAYTIGVATLEL